MGDKQAYQEYEPCVWSADTLPRVHARARIEIHAPSLIGPGTISVLGWDGSEKLRAGQSAVNLACSKYVRAFLLVNPSRGPPAGRGQHARE